MLTGCASRPPEAVCANAIAALEDYRIANGDDGCTSWDYLPTAISRAQSLRETGEFAQCRTYAVNVLKWCKPNTRLRNLQHTIGTTWDGPLQSNPDSRTPAEG